MENFSTWIGNKETALDISNVRPILMLQALLNQNNQKLTQLPTLSHWLYFLPIFNHEQLSADGHPHKGGFLPPIPFPKRMWAGGRVSFLQPISFNQDLRRESEIIKVEFKQGKSGDMYFVTVKHMIYANDLLAIVEEQDIVYRDISNSTAPTVQAPVSQAVTISVPKMCSYKKPFKADTPALFRYSALTFNGHKIHYDRPYAMEQEGYPGLVVHGPFLATLLAHHFKAEYPQYDILQFDFRAMNPVFDFDEFFICGDVHSGTAELWIEKANGQIAMKASIRFKEG